MLNTNRLIFEPVTRNHATEMQPLLSSLELYRYIDSKPPSFDELTALYQKWELRKSPDGAEEWLNWIARERSSGKAVGYFQAGVPTARGSSSEPYVAYVIGTEFQNQGFAAEGLASLISFLRIEKELNEIKAWVDTRNLRSIHLLEKSGFEKIDHIKNAGFFNGATSDEFVFSLKLKSLVFEDYDVSYLIDPESLREKLHSQVHAAAQSDLLRRTAAVEARKAPSLSKPSDVAKSLGKAGVLLKMLGRLEEAHQCLSKAIFILNDHSKPTAELMTQFIRYYDVLRFQGKMEESESGFLKCLRLTEENPDLWAYRDFAFQHLGKLYFEWTRFDSAKKCFEAALELRLAKKDETLLESTRLALKAVERKLNQP